MTNSRVLQSIIKKFKVCTVLILKNINLKNINKKIKIKKSRELSEKIISEIKYSDHCNYNGNILIDAQWDNPNYWLRVGIFRKSLGLPNRKEIGLLGKYNKKKCKKTLLNFGINKFIDFSKININKKNIRKKIDLLINSTKNPEDILLWDLPEKVPGSLIYDGILKKQRLACVDIKDPNFKSFAYEALLKIESAKFILKKYNINLVIISHTLGIDYGILAWVALNRKINVIFPFGLFGVIRMVHMKKKNDLFKFYDSPSKELIDNLSKKKSEQLAFVGNKYIHNRLEGKSDDLASLYAYKETKKSIHKSEICEMFGWNEKNKIIGFYASNWYDWPHQLGMCQFRDFLDWTKITFQEAVKNKDVNWIFKPHPAEEWFGKIKLENILEEMPHVNHVKIIPSSWSNKYLFEIIDGLITYHGTSGIECACYGKPVLLPDIGKYHESGFSKVAKNKQDYIKLLSENWWEKIDLKITKKRAAIFSGLWFCSPKSQGKFILKDDALQDDLYELIPNLIKNNRKEVFNEIEHLKDWFLSEKMYSHTFKMMKANSFQLSNIQL